MGAGFVAKAFKVTCIVPVNECQDAWLVISWTCFSLVMIWMFSVGIVHVKKKSSLISNITDAQSPKALVVHLHEQVSKFSTAYLTLNLILFRDVSSIPLLDWKQRKLCIFHDLAHCFPILFIILAWLSYVGLFPWIYLIL